MTSIITIALSVAGVAIIAVGLHQVMTTTIAAERRIQLSAAMVACASIVNQSWLSSRGTIAISTSACIILAVFIMMWHWQYFRNVKLTARHALLALIPLWLFVADAILYTGQGTASTFSRLLPVLLLATLLPVFAASIDPLRAVRAAVLIGFGLACSMTFFAPQAWTPCTQFKCGPFNELFAGPFSSGNYIAAAASVAIVCALTLRGTATKIVVLSSSILVVFATNSRTTQVALALALIAYALAKRLASHKVIIAWSATITSTVIGLALVYSAGPADYSNRGGIWTLGTRALGDDWLWGAGITSWTPEVLARNYMHSQGLLLLYSGGAIAVALFVAFIATSLITNSEYLPLAWGVGVLTLVRGLTEVAWNPLAVDGTLLLVLPLVFLISSLRDSSSHVADTPFGQTILLAAQPTQSAGANVQR